jgi:predicted permease
LWESTVSTLWRDVRYGARMLRRAPGFTLTAVLTLGLGIGATTALFSVASAVLLQPLPVANPHQIVYFRWTAPPLASPTVSIAGMSIDPKTGTRASTAFSHAVFQAMHADPGVLSDVIAFASASTVESAPGLRDGARGHLVTGNYFRVLGLAPRLGRLLTPDDARDDASPVVVLSHRYWLRHFAAADDAIGRELRFERFSAPVVGVAPAGFTGLGQLGDAPDFFLPLNVANAGGGAKGQVTRLNTPWVWPLRIFGRLQSGRSAAAAEAALQEPFHRGAALAWTAGQKPQPAPAELPRLIVEPGAQGLAQTRDGLRETFALLALVVGAILLIVCVNLVNLQLARAETRHGEMAVRLAIGAKRLRLVRQLITESLLLAGLGATLGLVVAWLGKDVLLAWLTRVNPSFVIEPAVDVTVLLFSGAVAMLVGIAIGLAPAVRATRASLATSAQLAERRSTRNRAWLRRGLLVTQVGLSVVLLVISGLLLRTLVHFETAEVGFDRRSVLLFNAVPTAPLASSRAASGQALTAAYDRLRSALTEQPGVTAAAYGQYSLLGGELAMPTLTVPGQPREPGEDRTVYTQSVSPQFFATAGIPLTAGRTFVDSDRGRRVAVVNETLARRFFANGDAIGRFVGMSKDPEAPDLPLSALMEIVGIVRDAKYMTLREQTPPTLFVPFFQNPGEATFMVRSAGDSPSLADTVGRVAREVTPVIAVVNVRMQDEETARTYARESHMASLATLFGVLALVLTAIGLYGLLSYSVARRTREIGLRMALGAQRWNAVASILGETAWLLIAGVAVGVLASSTASRFVASLLFGVAANDAATYAVVVGVLAVVACAAAALPARRAAHVDPAIALRAD